MGRYLYCQNTSCGQYLGCSGGDSCSICGWCAGRYMGDENDDANDSEEEGNAQRQERDQ